MEALAISSLVSSGDIEAFDRLDLKAKLFPGFEAEFRWLQGAVQIDGRVPTQHALMLRFPDFPFVEGADDLSLSVKELRRRYLDLQVKQVIEEAAEAAHRGDLEEAVLLMGGFKPDTQAAPLVDALTDLSALEQQANVKGIPVPWELFNHHTGGFLPGDLWYMAARLGQGKSWNALSAVLSALNAGKTVTYFSLEMPRIQIVQRIHSLLARQEGYSDLDYRVIRSGEYNAARYRGLLALAKEKKMGELYVVDPSHGRTTPTLVQGRARDCDLVVIDHVGLMATPSGQRAIEDWRSMATISNMLKEVALSVGTPILGLAQVNRTAEGRDTGWRPPKVSQLSQSDALGQDGDVVITHRRYGNSTQVMSLEKNRAGVDQLLQFTLFEPDVGMFGCIDPEEARIRKGMGS